jgi:diguanylate cyclase (GGDEF)-like protein/PAS domain S-box-containing protein
MPYPLIKKQYYQYLVIFSPLLVGVVMSVIIGTLRDYSDRNQEARMSLVQLETFTEKINGVEWETLQTGKLTPENQAFGESLPRATEKTLNQLHALHSRRAEISEVETHLKQYVQAVQTEFTLLKTGKIAEAHQIDEEKVDSMYLKLIEDIKSTNNLLARNEKKSKLFEIIGSTLTILLFSTGVSFLIFHLNTFNKKSAQIMADQVLTAQREKQLRSLIQNASDIILILNLEGEMCYVSPAMQAVLGYPAESMLQKNAFELVHPEDLGRARVLFQQICAQQNTSTKSEFRLRHQSGLWRHLEIITNNLLSDPGISGILVTLRDITERKSFEAELLRQAFRDTLTGLANRMLFTESVSQALARAQRKESTLAVIFVDLDNFKVVNDSLGHDAGDMLLIIVGERLQAAVRSGDTTARLGGDEFTLLLEDIQDPDEATQVAQRVLAELRRPILLGTREVFVSASIGIALSTGADSDTNGLLRDADTAMYQAKYNGKSRYVVFNSSMNDQAMERLELETDLRYAVQNDELRLHYQPIVELQSGRITGIEALVRWKHPRRGLIPPADFIPIAEETGLIVPIGMWVLEEACQQVKQWHQQYPIHPPMAMSVNISGRQIQLDSIVEDIARVLEKTGMDPRNLKLEITESVVMLNVEEATERLHRLKDMGIRIAVDDFGTGYSSMAYLAGLPIDTVKIDRSFTAQIGHTRESEAVVRAIISLAKSLHLSVTSEGIETLEQLEQLQELGCELGQGFYFSRPMTNLALEALLGSLPAAEKSLQKAA